MSRSDPRRTITIREEKPAAPPPARGTEAEDRGKSAPEEPFPLGWNVAAFLWAVSFLFLTALIVYDLIAGLLRT